MNESDGSCIHHKNNPIQTIIDSDVSPLSEMPSNLISLKNPHIVMVQCIL